MAGGQTKNKAAFYPDLLLLVESKEIWFNILSKDVLKGGIWISTHQLIEYIDPYNRTRAKPFTWTYDGAPLKKLVTYLIIVTLVSPSKVVAERFIADGDYVVVEAKGENIWIPHWSLRPFRAKNAKYILI